MGNSVRAPQDIIINVTVRLSRLIYIRIRVSWEGEEERRKQISGKSDEERRRRTIDLEKDGIEKREEAEESGEG